MDKQYRHLSAEERAVILIERTAAVSQRSIAGKLGRDVSILSRELSRNRLPEDLAAAGEALAYDPTTAAMAYRLRRQS